MIAYYAHQQGYGHCNSAQEFFKAFPNKTVVITAADFKFDNDLEVVRICNEDTNYTAYLSTSDNLPKYAHYLPKSKSKILHRNFQILESCISENIRFALVDVSVETAIQFRIAGIPYAYHKMLGTRNDMPHQIAYEASEFLFAYYPKKFEPFKHKSLNSKTYYLGFISRFKYRPIIESLKFTDNSIYNILILIGKGGSDLDSQIIKSICLQNPKYHFTIIGSFSNLKSISNLTIVDFTSTLKNYIVSADIVISSCGLNMTAEILSLKHKFIAFAEERAYDEQNDILKGLINEKLAVELDFDDLKKNIESLINLPNHPDLKSLFGSMTDFRNIELLKPYL